MATIMPHFNSIFLVTIGATTTKKRSPTILAETQKKAAKQLPAMSVVAFLSLILIASRLAGECLRVSLV